VRRKFLRKPQTEFGHVSEAVTRIALAWPSIRFRLVHGRRTIFELPATDRWRDRITDLIGGEIGEFLVPVEHVDEEFTLRGYVAEPGFHRSHARMQYLFLNGRFIRDRALQHALSEAYRGLLLTGKYPVCFLRMEMPPSWVDVNVHPTKMEVRFRDGGRIYRGLLSSIRTRFLETDLTARVGSGSVPSARPADDAWSAPVAPTGAIGEPLAGSGTASNSALVGRDPTESPRADADSFGTARSYEARAAAPPTSLEPPATETPAPPVLVERPVSGRGIQVQNRYLIAEEGDGIVVIDQHALHERVLYERLKAKHLTGKLERQALLVPQPVTLRPAEVSAVLEARTLLEELGLSVESFGGDTVLVSAYPAILGNIDPEALLRQVVELLMSEKEGIERRDLLENLLQMMACKGAVKAGDRLSDEEIEALLEQRHLCHDAHHCPHGRPTALVFSRAELDRRFQRT